MRVSVLLFAALREALGTAQVDVDVPATARVRDVLEQLRRSHPTLAQRRFAIALNRSYGTEDQPVSDGDQIALIPPVSGG